MSWKIIGVEKSPEQKFLLCECVECKHTRYLEKETIEEKIVLDHFACASKWKRLVGETHNYCRIKSFKGFKHYSSGRQPLYEVECISCNKTFVIPYERMKYETHKWCDCLPWHKPSKLNKLLNYETDYEAAYWIGFLLADGCFYDTGRVSLQLANKDKAHLLKFATYIDYVGKVTEGKSRKIGKYTSQETSKISVTDRDTIIELRKKFSIVNNKTENPCNIEFTNHLSFLSFLIGFIDGDGCIYLNSGLPMIVIDIHRSWEATLQKITNEFFYLVGTSPPKVSLHKNMSRSYFCEASSG